MSFGFDRQGKRVLCSKSRETERKHFDDRDAMVEHFISQIVGIAGGTITEMRRRIFRVILTEDGFVDDRNIFVLGGDEIDRISRMCKVSLRAVSPAINSLANIGIVERVKSYDPYIDGKVAYRLNPFYFGDPKKIPWKRILDGGDKITIRVVLEMDLTGVEK